MEFITEPFAAAAGIDYWQPTADCDVNLLDLVEDVSACLLQKRTIAFGCFDIRQQFDVARDVSQFPARKGAAIPRAGLKSRPSVFANCKIEIR